MNMRDFGPLAPERLYLHSPWCRTVCPYCAFPVQALRQGTTDTDFAALIAREWSAWRSSFAGAAGPWRSIYFGGGTPSLLPVDDLAQILDVLGARRSDCEITLEANPDDICAERVGQWRELGITRVSVGVQSFQPELQKRLGRAREARHLPSALASVAQHFGNWTLDLIYGSRWHSRELWQADLAAVRHWRPPHLSTYALTVEPGTAYARWSQRSGAVAADDERVASQYHEMCEQLDWLAPYEVSNWSTQATAARHNSAYWNRESCLALGPGAQGLLRNASGAELRYGNTEALSAWRHRVLTAEMGTDWWDPVDPAARRIEEIMLGLRSARGVSLVTIGAAYMPRLQLWQASGFGYTVGDRFFLHPREWIRADLYVDQLLREVP